MFSKDTRILFLDVDGVLNYELFYISKYQKNGKLLRKFFRKLVKKKEISRIEYKKGQICPIAMKMINELCAELDMKVVISSTWRKAEKTFDELKELFKNIGAEFEIIGITPTLRVARGCEIHQWIYDNIDEPIDYKNYVILDDDIDFLLKQQNHFFKCDPYTGVTPTICNKIIYFFNNKTFPNL